MNCEKCGHCLPADAVFCPQCGQRVGTVPASEKQENVFTGIVGALLGAVLGGIVVVVLAQFGAVAPLAGLALGFLILMGYRLLGNVLSHRGIIICMVLLAVAPYISDRFSWAVTLMAAYSSVEGTLLQFYGTIPTLIDGGSIPLVAYLQNLALLYMCTIIGGFVTIRLTLVGWKRKSAPAEEIEELPQPEEDEAPASQITE